jgi:hypothetical protein
LVVTSSFAPADFGLGGLFYLDGLAWALIVTSASLLWISKRSTELPACGLCDHFKNKGESFCGSCGRLVAPLASPPSRRLLGLGVFAIVMLAALALTVPIVASTPSVSLNNYGLGGPRVGNQFAPLSGWGATTSTLSENGQPVYEYTLTKGSTSIVALVAASQNPQALVSALNKTRPDPATLAKVPASVSQSYVGYSFEQKGTTFVDLQGVFQVCMLGPSGVQTAFVVVDLRQTMTSFTADHGSALYGAATSVIAWTSASSRWSGIVENMTSVFQLFSQLAYVCSFAGFGVVLFTAARDDELAKTRRLESMHALEEPETAVLNALGPGSHQMTGAQLRESMMQLDPWVSETVFYSSLEELARRGLVSGSPTRNWRPMFLWKRLV